MIDLSIENIPLDDEKVYDLLCDANSIGVFQLESPVGRRILKEVQPRNIQEVADCITLIRPGTLEGKLADDKSIKDHYVMRKHGREPAEQPIKALEPILSDTYQLMIFQEQAIKIANEIAGFSLEESDSLRKAMGKKDVKLMTEVKEKFIKGCLDVGKVSEKEANEIADAIEKSQRYSFNKSHAIGYSYISYWSAYCKVHFPIQFYCSYLNHSKDRPKPHEELKKLVYDAYKNNVEIYPPEIERLNSDFVIDNDIIYYGLSHIKNVGDSCIKQLIEINEITPLRNMSWLELLFKVLLKINKSCSKAFMASGALRNISPLKREQMMYDYDHASKLTKKEQEYVRKNFIPQKGDQLKILLQNMISMGAGKGKPLSNKNRINVLTGLISSLENPNYDISDNISRLINYEQSSLGLPMTCYHYDDGLANQAYCIDLSKKQIADHKTVNVAARIDYLKEYSNDRGKIGYLGILDNTAELRGVKCYTKVWEEFSHVLQQGKDYIFEIVPKNKSDYFIINNVHLI